ncbi:MAG: DUF1566 domain-containing protein [Coraliomargarita sp.]
MNAKCPSLMPLMCLCFTCTTFAAWPPSPVVDTGQVLCFDRVEPIHPPKEGHEYFGQDAQYQGVQANYTDNGDGTVTDEVTGLIWSKACDPRKVTLYQAMGMAERMTLGGYRDWRVPTIKELYSLIDFRGATGVAGRNMSEVPRNAIPYINTDYFEFRYGDVNNGERFIDGQWLTQTTNVSPIMNGNLGLFGVNFADGRIKCYPNGRDRRGKEKTFYVRFVRGRTDYGVNDYVDNGDGTITDRATGLTWTQADSGKGMNWLEALEYAERSTYAGHRDWRLPNAKELQSIVDYNRSPDHTRSAAIDPIFSVSQIENEAGQADYPYFWTSTTHVDGPNASQAVYISFGRAIGEMHGRIIDAHGAGAQRSDPKDGEPRLGHGPQGDAQRIENYVRLVRNGAIQQDSNPNNNGLNEFPNRIQVTDTFYKKEDIDYQQRSPHGSSSGGHFGPPPEHHGGHPPRHGPPPRH